LFEKHLGTDRPETGSRFVAVSGLAAPVLAVKVAAAATFGQPLRA
jgi:hypothetical protein